MQSARLKGLLALPLPLRRVVFEAVLPPQSHSSRTITTWKNHPPSFVTSNPPRSLSYIPPPSNQPNPVAPAILVPPPSPESLDLATSLFLSPPPRFLYSAPRFLNIPRNNRVPEICILGRSNVGKSTLLNALAGLETHGRAGRSYGAKTSRIGLAITSPKAGCTKMINAYGFGPAVPHPPAPGEAEVAPTSEGDRDWREKTKPLSTLRKQAQRRGAGKGEAAPQHSLVLLDMPGYGYRSEVEWGREISKYLSRREMLRGAVVLVDAVAGLKPRDLQAFGLLRDAGVPMMVVITRADKLEASFGAHKVEEKIHGRCRSIWHELRQVEVESLNWTEGKGWDRELYVTGAGDPKNGSLGVAGLRLALARMAGLLEEEVGRDTAVDSLGKGRSEKIVPFDRIQWAPRIVDGKFAGRRAVNRVRGANPDLRTSF